jgi:hypothetical protein
MNDTAVLGEGGAHFAGGAVVIVGKRLDDHGDAARPVTLVADFVIAFGIVAGRLFDGALNIVLRHVLGTGGQDGGAQARIERRVGQAHFGRHCDFARELAEQLGAHLILAPLAVHDVLELGMTGHDSNCNVVDAGGVIGWARGKINIVGLG